MTIENTQTQVRAVIGGESWLSGNLSRIRDRRRKSEGDIRGHQGQRIATELSSFLGMVKYYGRFNHNLATLCQPLNRLLQEWHGYGTRSFRCLKS